MKKWIAIAGLSTLLLVGCTNNGNTIGNEEPANTLPRDTNEIENDAERDFEGRDFNNQTNENTINDNGETNNLNENPQAEIIEDLNRENDVD